MRIATLVASVVSTVGLFASTTALAAPGRPALDLGVGFGGVTLENSVPEIENSVGGNFHLNYSFAPFRDVEQLRFGVGFMIEGASEQGPRTQSTFDPRVRERPYSRVSSFTPEFKVAWSQPLGERWFIEPSVALAVPIAHYEVGELESYRDYYGYYDVDDSETRIGIGVRPGLQVGYWLAERHAIGLELNYLFATIDFRNVGPSFEAYSIGFFYRLAF
ncbi:MAG TPA: hypothetical protein VGN72_08075 [Tepidisphaeraceae bacterium]|jgi:hypothetical protein|nr:hypothetical protein [Tepidisphaeraceae bacterium]